MNAMFKNILVPTDLSERTVKSLGIAIDMALLDGGVITLLHIIEMIEDEDEKEFQDFYDRLRDRAQRKMDEIASQYEHVKLPINREILFGKRVLEIIRFAGEYAVDLIIMSSHKIERLSAGEGWATISYRVGILAPCPVLMVK